MEHNIHLVIVLGSLSQIENGKIEKLLKNYSWTFEIIRDVKNMAEVMKESAHKILKELNIINVPIHFFGIRDIDILFLGLEFKFPVALTFVILFESWRYFPLAMLFILARLQSVPTELFEAADIDGATPIQKFKFITWPLILSNKRTSC